MLGSVLAKTQARVVLFCATKVLATDLIVFSMAEDTKRRAEGGGRRFWHVGAAAVVAAVRQNQAIR